MTGDRGALQARPRQVVEPHAIEHRFPGREALRQRYTELFYVESMSAPAVRGERYFYVRTHKALYAFGGPRP